MDIRFSNHNLHLSSIEDFAKLDPHLRLLTRQPLVFESKLLDSFMTLEAGVYIVSGGRQVGKTTLLKQWMLRLLQHKTLPENIAYITGELIDDHHGLVREISDLLKDVTGDLFYLLLDEVTYIKEWDRGIKYLLDTGVLEKTVLMVTGSDTILIEEARTRLPGRRGKARQLDFHLYPLSFFESVALKGAFNSTQHEQLQDNQSTPDPALTEQLFMLFDHYLIHGGFLTAINDWHQTQSISYSTLRTYSDWIRGDVRKRGKNEQYLIEICTAIIKHYGSQITWNNLAKDLSIDHPKTVADYVSILSSMNAVWVQAAIIEEKLTAAPKKAKKIMYTDPFIFHAIQSWLHPSQDPFVQNISPRLQDTVWASRLVESTAATLYSRNYPTYYIKAEGEVDIAYVKRQRFWPIEIKWTTQSRPKDLKQIAKYKNGTILNKSKTAGQLQQIPTLPLPLALYRLG
jgi:predicted AAA+ superfamily ATPase